MRLRYAFGPLSALFLSSHIAAADAGAGGDASADAANLEEAGSSGALVAAPEERATEEAGAGGGGPVASFGASSGGKSSGGSAEAFNSNQELIEEYTSDHGCRCSAVGADSETPLGWLSGLALAGALILRTRRRG